MPPFTGKEQKAKREYSQLLRIQERLLHQLQRVRDELGAPSTVKLLREIRNRTGTQAPESLGKVTAAVEQAIRALKVYESEIRRELLDDDEDYGVEGIPNLPAPLGRFLAERSEMKGFEYEITEDEIRGWVIRWKEYSENGTVRGSGQFYERPYAWLDE